jgi:CheY-like chemotaxis protein
LKNQSPKGAPKSASAEAEKGAPGKGGTVLVIDDSDIARAMMAEALRERGLSVVELPSPIGATRAILAHNVTVVVVDVMMPSMRGDRLAALFRSNPRFKNLGVVLVSGESEVNLALLLKEVRADAAVSKSKLAELVRAVVRIQEACLSKHD